MKTTDFIAESIGTDADAMHQDHEVQLARQECYNAAKDAIALHKILAAASEEQGLEGWISEKLTLAADYLKTVKEHLEYNQLEHSQSLLPEFTFEAAEAQYQQGVAEGKKRVSEMTAGGTGAGGFATGPAGGGTFKKTTGVPKKVKNTMKRVAPKLGKGIY